MILNRLRSLTSFCLQNARRSLADNFYPLVSNGDPPSFGELYNLPSFVVENLGKQGLIRPMEIQKNSLTSLLDPSCNNKYSVINAETGSGKTLCFLLPILKMFGEEWLRNGSIPTACAAVLVPSPHLAQQITDVFRSLAHPEWNTSVAAFHHSTFSFTKHSHLLVGVPGKLKHYSIDTLFAKNRILCLDEVDMLLGGGEVHVTKNILKYVEDVHQSQRKTLLKDSADEKDCLPDVEQTNLFSLRPQIIMTAATLPMNGPKTVGMQLSKLFPQDVTFIKTENTHKVPETAELRFVNFLEESKDIKDKFTCLEKDLDELGDRVSDGENSTQLPKVLIFANTVESASNIASFLTREHGEAVISVQEGSSGHKSKWWSGKVGSFFKKPGVHNDVEREQVLRDFRQGILRVLVCTDLASRGLDFPDCNCIIQFDFPDNCEFFLHRAGRTSRAGRSGIVISYVGNSDVDMANEIQKSIDTRKSLDNVFSRNKMFRKRIKRRMKKDMDVKDSQ